MKESVILNGGFGAWAFTDLANDLAQKLAIKVSETPGDYNYILSWDEKDRETCHRSFIPFEGMKLASDKRLLAQVFQDNDIPIPETHLLDSHQEVVEFIGSDFDQWCLKYPIGCGASGHRIIRSISDIPQDWLRPYVVQRFIYLDDPRVYRIYCAGQKLFGWNVRKFPNSVKKQAWVAHAQGAVYEVFADIPEPIIDIATKTFKATSLFNSFGCADFIQDNDGSWLVLEVGTDGIFNHVDRNIDNPSLEEEILENISVAFQSSSK